jgi:uncharacterized phiE125 gp8 family phage protein
MDELLTLEDARTLLRVEDGEDPLLARAIEDAKAWIENYTGLALTQRTVTKALRSFDSAISEWPIASIDSVAYLDASGQEVIVANTDYVALIRQRPARLSAPRWPAVYSGSAVMVTMTAGFADAAAVRAYAPTLPRALRILVAGFYEDREGGTVLAGAVKAARGLCRQYKRWAT